jgi:hypothetical protein
VQTAEHNRHTAVGACLVRRCEPSPEAMPERCTGDGEHASVSTQNSYKG